MVFVKSARYTNGKVCQISATILNGMVFANQCDTLKWGWWTYNQCASDNGMVFANHATLNGEGLFF
jgi:hypothetical protein